MIRTLAAVLGAIAAIAVIAVVLAACGTPSRHVAWSYPPCKPGTHMAYIAKQMVCLRDGWHWPHWF